MAKWSATASNLPSYGERVISSVKWKAVISEIYDYLHTVRTASYGTVEPTAENGELWYDTNVGQNKLKVKTATGWFGISSDLPIASSAILGGVKVGNTLTIDSSGVLNAYALNIAGQKIEPSTTPTANKIPVADEDGKIDDGWINDAIARNNSPALTGTPTAPTAAVGTNTTQVATTAFVNAEIASDRPYATVAPVMDGTAAVGTSAKVAREDHKHPVDTSRAAASHTHDYLATTGKAADSDKLDGYDSATDGTASTVPVRDSSGDITTRLFRSTYANQATISGALAFRTNTTDNYIRFCSDMAAVRTFIGCAATSHTHDYVPTARTVTAGNGMSGGGALSANITLTLGTPGSCSTSTSNAATSTSHTHTITGVAAASHTHSYVPIASSSALPVGTLCVCSYVPSSGSVANGSTTSGSNLKAYGPTTAKMGTLAGTWKNISGVIISNGGTASGGPFVRTA